MGNNQRACLGPRFACLQDARRQPGSQGDFLYFSLTRAVLVRAGCVAMFPCCLRGASICRSPDLTFSLVLLIYICVNILCVLPLRRWTYLFDYLFILLCCCCCFCFPNSCPLGMFALLQRTRSHDFSEINQI